MTIFDKLLTKFDHIYMLTLSHRKDRQHGILSLLKELGYDENNINHIKKFSIIYTTSWKFNAYICRAINDAYQHNNFTKANEYDCTRNHYNILKTAYDLGYEKVLVFEDDIQFLKPRRLNDFIVNFPEDYSLVLMNGFTVNSQIAIDCQNAYNDGMHFLEYTGNLWCTGMYAVSRTGMEHYINYINNRCTVADMPLYLHPDKGYYISTYPLAIQADKTDIPSDIRNNSNDQINYANLNEYEYLDKTKYLPFTII